MGGIAFLGYVLPFGQMSFWGATVITNLLSPFPCLIEWVCGGYCVNSPTLKRFFVFHFVFPYVTLGIVVIHIYFLHFHSSNNPSRLITNNRISFFPFIFIKDLVLSQESFTYISCKHILVSLLSHILIMHWKLSLLTPLHIVPEWYFLCQYAMLKAVPNKNAGFIIL